MSRIKHIHRVAVLDKIVIPYPAFSTVINNINDCIMKTEAYREPVGCLLLGRGGMGKSTISRAVLSTMKRSTKRDGAVEKTIVPGFYSEIPSPVTVKGVAANMLRDLGAPPSSKSATHSDLKIRLCTLLAAAETKFIFIDETHNLFLKGNRSTSSHAEVYTWLIELVNKAKVSFCLAGIPEFAPYLSADSQLLRRFPMQLHLIPLLPGDQSQPGPLIPFLTHLMREATARLQLTAAPKLDDLFSCTQVFAATAGNPSFIVSLVKETALHALGEGRQHVSIDDFAAAWDGGMVSGSTLVKENPFRMSEAGLAGALRRSV